MVTIDSTEHMRIAERRLDGIANVELLIGDWRHAFGGGRFGARTPTFGDFDFDTILGSSTGPGCIRRTT